MQTTQLKRGTRFTLSLIISEVNSRRLFIPTKMSTLWRGNISFHQHISSKCHKFCLKLFALCNCKTGSVQNIVLYTGAGIEITDYKSLGLSGAVVMTLMKPYLD